MYAHNLDFEMLENDRKIVEIGEHISKILTLIGEDPNREGLVRTPERVAKVIDYLTMGADQEKDVEEVLSNSQFTHEYDEMVLIKDIEFYSLCEHHMLPFFGKAHIAYIPDGKVVGLSKIPRIVDIYARRLQIQERMTMQIKEAIQKYLEPKGVAVLIQASHMCMMVRGVQKQQSKTVTSSLSGEFLTDPKTREEFMSLVFGQF